MEGSDNKPLPEDKGAKKGMTKNTKMILAVVVVIILVAAAVGAALLWNQPAEKSTPEISFTASATSAAPGDDIEFNATATTGEPTEYKWYFGDGNVTTTDNPVVSHSYAEPGKYLIVLAASNSDNTGTNFNSPISVTIFAPSETPTNDSIPIAFSTVSAQFINSGIEVKFNGTQSAGYGWDPEFNESQGGVVASSDFIKLMSWDFGDLTLKSGNYSEMSVVNHVFMGNDTMYTVKLKVTGTNDEISWYYITIVLSASGSSGKTFLEITSGEPEGLDPAMTYDSASGGVIQNIYENLLYYKGGSQTELMPVLATEIPTVENGGISADGLTYTFNLRQDVYFHNGEQMKASDVEFSLERVLTINDINYAAWLLGQAMIPNYVNGAVLDATDIANSVTVTDDYTVVIHLAKPYSPFLYVIAHSVACIMSEVYVTSHGDTMDEQKDWMKYHTCGTGAYSLVKWNTGDNIILTRNENYWGPTPPIAQVTIKYESSWGSRLLAIQKGDFDYCYVPVKYKNVVDPITGLNISQGEPTVSETFIGFNQHINTNGNTLDYGNIPDDFFNQTNVRLSFAAAFDYDKYLQILYNTAVQPNGFVPIGWVDYNASIPKFVFNLTMAKQYLANTTNPETGNSWLDDGFTMTVYYNNGNDNRRTAGELIKEGMESLAPGKIEITVQGLEWGDSYLPNLYAANFPLFVLGWLPDIASADNYMNPFFDQNGTYGYLVGLRNATLTALVYEATFELNQTLRYQMFTEINMINYENALYVPITQATNYAVFNDRVSGWVYNPMYSDIGFYKDLDVEE